MLNISIKSYILCHYFSVKDSCNIFSSISSSIRACSSACRFSSIDNLSTALRSASVSLAVASSTRSGASESETAGTNAHSVKLAWIALQGN